MDYGHEATGCQPKNNAHIIITRAVLNAKLKPKLIMIKSEYNIHKNRLFAKHKVPLYLAFFIHSLPLSP